MSSLSESSMKLIEFVNELNPNWVLAPIYRKGASMRSGKEATGKNPLEVAFERISVLRSARENQPWCCWLFGRKGQGIVISISLAVSSASGASHQGAFATSTRRTRPVHLHVPEELWGGEWLRP